MAMSYKNKSYAMLCYVILCYNALDSFISATSRTDKLILLGDFNAKVGIDHQTWDGAIGTEGVGKCNSNGLLLLKKCSEHELLIINTVFRLPTRNKTLGRSLQEFYLTE